MGIFRFENKYAAPTRQQRERYMKGEVEEHHFGPEGEITLLLYHEAAYLKDDIDNVRVLFTGVRDKPHAVEEARRMVEYHQLAEERMKSFTSGNQPDRGG
jgi:CO/xanthine dehydrogenase FAD-binding subunit